MIGKYPVYVLFFCDQLFIVVKSLQIDMITFICAQAFSIERKQ